MPELAAALRGALLARRGQLVALGGGRVVDVAKALAAADPPRSVVAVPTTLSAAEMSGRHRHAAGVPDATPTVRAALVVNDPTLSASAPVPELAASSANALAHAVTALACARPVSGAVGRDAARRIAGAWHDGEPDRDALALGALLAGWALDHTGLALHHVLAQTAVRSGRVGHAEANAALLPFTIGALSLRAPGPFAELDRDLGGPLEDAAAALRARTSTAAFAALVADPPALEACVTAALGRRELERVPPTPDRAEIAALYRAAGTP